MAKTPSKNGQLTVPTKKTTSKSSKESVDFQKQFALLEQITDNFEAGKYDLETGLKKFEEGLELAQALKEHLEQVENRIESIKGKYELTQEDE